MDVQHLVDKVQMGQLDLQPDFQRGQVWPDPKKRRLIDTILREWYIPAIHIVVNDELDREEVLDGQQRLRAIIGFINGEFSVDGTLPPSDPNIESLHGLYFEQLPDRVRSRFKRFVITTVRLRDYKPDEPGELFFRLNQLTALTAAEQRNALVGEPRNQIRRLAERLEIEFGGRGIGFSNARMNFDDVLSRLAFSLEQSSLSIKMTSHTLERRYRNGKAFSKDIFDKISYSLTVLSNAYDKTYAWKQNKASLFSWLFHIIDNVRADGVDEDHFLTVFNSFELCRHSIGHHDGFIDATDSFEYSFVSDKFIRAAVNLFSDRASSRVNDTTSLVLRDLALNVVALQLVGRSYFPEEFPDSMLFFLQHASHQLAAMYEWDAEQHMSESALANEWSRLRETRETV